MRLNIGYVILLFLTSAVNAQERKDTLHLVEALNIAHANAISQKQSLLTFHRAKLDYDLLLTELKPSLVINANLPNYFKSSFGVIQPNGSLSFQSISQDNSLVSLELAQKIGETNTTLFAQTNMRRFDDFSDNFTSYNSLPVRIGVIQPLNQINPYKWNRALLRLDKEIAELNTTINQENVSVDVVRRYFDLLGDQVNEKIANTNKENSSRQFEIALERYALGKISKSDLLQLELNMTSVGQNEIAARRSVYESHANFNSALNFFFEITPIVTLPSPMNKLYIDPEVSANKAWNNRPENKESERLLVETQRALEEAKRNNGWQANLQASIGYIGSAETLEKAYSNPQNEIIAQLSISVPLLDGGKRKKSIERALLTQAYANYENTFNESTFKQNVRQVVLQFNQLQEEITLARKSYNIAEERYKIANERFLLGDISITDLIWAYSERDNSWRSYISVSRAYWISYYTIRQLTLYDFLEDVPLN